MKFSYLLCKWQSQNVELLSPRGFICLFPQNVNSSFSFTSKFLSPKEDEEVNFMKKLLRDWVTLETWWGWFPWRLNVMKHNKKNCSTEWAGSQMELWLASYSLPSSQFGFNRIYSKGRKLPSQWYPFSKQILLMFGYWKVKWKMFISNDSNLNW